MTNGELLRQLFRGYVRRDDDAFTSAAQEVVREERLKNHRLLADDLERILRNGNGRVLGSLVHRSPDIPKDRERGFPLFTVAEFDYSWDRLVLPSKTMQVLDQLTREYRRRDLLIAAGIRPKQRVLFYGPPGCGKTLAARVLAGVMSRPLITVRFDAVISSYLGETAANLRRVFEFIERGQWVVLFDEFDAIGKERDNPFEHGELKRVVNSLLQLMDAYGGESLLIAATNHEGLLDSAVWRRFEAVVGFPPPTLQDRVLLLRMFLRGVDASRLDLEGIARRLNGATGGDVERVAVESVRPIARNFAPPEGRLFRTVAGTSFAAPRIANLASRLIREFPDASSNLIRALIIDSARVPSDRPPTLQGLEQSSDEVLRLYGYGQPDYDRARWSGENDVLLLADGTIALDTFEIFEIPPLPDTFFEVSGSGYLSISLSFDPPTRHTRADSYLGVAMQFDLFRNVAAERVADALRLWDSTERKSLEDLDLPSLTGLRSGSGLPARCSLKPGTNRRSRGTAQRAVVKISNRSWSYDGQPLVLAVICQRKWAPQEIADQRFAVVASIYHENPEVNLYSQIRQQARQYQRVRVRV